MKKESGTTLLTRSMLESAYGEDAEGVVGVIEAAFRSFATGDVIFPEKSSQVFDERTQSRINCMPATIRSAGLAGVKWVSVFPENPSRHGLPNVGGLMVLSEIKTGMPVAVMDAGYLTAIRTAAVDALAARFLAPEGASTLALVGTGEQARFHAKLLSGTLDTIGEIRVSGRTPEHAAALAGDLRADGLDAVSFGDAPPVGKGAVLPQGLQGVHNGDAALLTGGIGLPRGKDRRGQKHKAKQRRQKSRTELLDGFSFHDSSFPVDHWSQFTKKEGKGHW